MRKTMLMALLASGSLCVAAAASAQDRPADSGGSSAVPQTDQSGLDEIIVTARRRAESGQNVPLAISAISADSIVRQGIRTDADLQASVPGLVIRTAGTANFINYVMRGESLDQYSGSVPGVQPYVDEVPFTANAALQFYDLEGIQVLKGPQGTLFGRNLTGGAVLYQTARPKDINEGYVSVQYGNYDRFITEGAMNLRINDAISLRVAGSHASGGAFIHNLYDGNMYGDKKLDSGRLSLSIKPSSNFTNVTVGEYTHSYGTNQPNFPYYVLPCGTQGGDKACTWNPSVPAFNTLINSPKGTYYPNYPNGYIFPGGLAALPGFLKSKGDYVVDSNATFDHDSTFYYAINTSTLDVAPNLTLKNIFGYSYSDSDDYFDQDASPYVIIDPGYDMPGSTQNFRIKSRQISNEFQLQGKALDGKLNYIFGLFYVDTSNQYDSAVRQVILTAPDTITPIAFRFHGFTKDTSYAVFTQATYAITDKLNMTAGGRWSWDKLSTYHLPDSIFYTGDTRQTAWENNPSWTFSLDYHFTPGLMVYATTRGSWRVGGYNLFAPAVGYKVTANLGGNYFLPEKVRDIEAGLKYHGRPGGVPVQFNISAYYQWMTDVQKTGYGLIDGTSASATVTVPSARVKGLETDLTVRPTDWLKVGGSFTLTDARFVDNVGYLYGVPAYFGPYGDTPKYSGTVFGDVTVPLGNDMGSLAYHVDAYAQSHFYFSNRADTFDPGTRLPGYTLLNMRLDWQDLAHIKGLTASVFVKNLTDKLYWTGGAPGAQVAGLVASSFGQPRTYGGSLRFSW